MYIKSLTLRGFLCYKDTTTVHFEPGLNLIVGPNGTGKSSILSGIRFVMGDLSVDRALCLHQGTSARVLVGYVSLVFDNSDKRLTGIDEPEVVVRREFGTKKDQYSLNGRRVSRQELQNLLEASGFSKTNPYYFVHQHEVTALTRMSHPERLKLLKDVAGTRVYDERRQEAFATLAETRERRKAINATLETIIQRMAELREEQQELGEVLELENERDCVEALSVAQDFETAEEKLQAAERQCKEADAKVDAEAAELRDLEGQIEEVEGLIIAANDATASRAELESARAEVVQRKREVTALQLRVATESEKASRKGEKRLRKEEALQQLREEEDALRRDCEKLHAAVEASASEMQALKLQYMKHTSELEALSDRVNFAKQYRTAKQRTQSLSAEIKVKERELTLLKEIIAKTQNQLQLAQIESKKEEREREQLTARVAVVEQGLQEVAKKIQAERERSHSGSRTELKEKAHEIRQSIDHLTSNLRQMTAKLNQTMRSAQLSANAAAKRWAKEAGKEKRVYGTLLENIRVDPKYRLAIETAAGPQILNLLVDDRHTAVAIISFLKKERAGGTTITPLKEVRQRQRVPSYPADDERVVPLMSLIECADHVKPAVQQVFGKFLLVDSADAGNEYARQDFCSITIDGDLVSRKGLLSGGFRSQPLRLTFQAEVTETARKIEEARKELHRVEALVEASAEASSADVTARRELEKERLKLQNEKIELSAQIARIQRRCATGEQAAERLIACLQETSDQIELVKGDILRKRREATAPTLEKLTPAEEQRVKELQKIVEKLEIKIDKDRQKHEAECRDLEEKRNTLNNTIRPRLTELEQELATTESDSASDDTLSELAQQLSEADEALKKSEAALMQLEEAKERQDSMRERRGNELESLRKEHAKRSRKVEILQQKATAVREAFRVTRLRRDELAQKQKRTMPTKLFEELSKLSPDELIHRAAQIARRLKKYSHVNRKARNQFDAFIDEEQRLIAQRDKLFKSEDSVLELMRSLDDQKDSTLLKTFENVNLEFDKVFSEIVSGGHAKLVLKKLSEEEIRKQREANANAIVLVEGEGPNVPQSVINIFTGVGMSVQFPSLKAYAPLESLSGGQKSVAALALMFALQRVECAPVYVLDEVDASLDVQYRGAVADLVSRQAKEHQIIAISHRSQLIDVADHHLKTSMINQVAGISPTTREEALAISQGDQENARPSRP